MTAIPPEVRVTCVIRATPEDVFDAWLSPDRMARFLCAGDTHVSALEADPRVGGAFRVVMADGQGEYDHRGRYLEISRPSRLRFTWASAATGHADTTVTMDFAPVREGTRVTLVHTGLVDPQARSHHEGGWASILAKCARLLEGAG